MNDLFMIYLISSYRIKKSLLIKKDNINCTKLILSDIDVFIITIYMYKANDNKRRVITHLHIIKFR